MGEVRGRYLACWCCTWTIWSACLPRNSLISASRSRTRIAACSQASSALCTLRGTVQLPSYTDNISPPRLKITSCSKHSIDWACCRGLHCSADTAHDHHACADTTSMQHRQHFVTNIKHARWLHLSQRRAPPGGVPAASGWHLAAGHLLQHFSCPLQLGSAAAAASQSASRQRTSLA